MTTITEVQFAHDDGALAEALTSHPEMDVRVLPETSTDPDRDQYVFTFDNADTTTIETALKQDHTVSTVQSMPQFGERNIWSIKFGPDTKLLAPHVTSEGGFVIDARSAQLDDDTHGWHERWLLPDREAVHDIWEYAREKGFEFEVLDLHTSGAIDAKHPIRIRDALTNQQREALLAAYQQGYFAEPREASLDAVADTLGHSPSAVSGRLKRGMRALIETTLLVDRT